MVKGKGILIMAKKAQPLTLETVFEVLDMFFQFKERATFDKMAKELKCTRFELWKFVREQGYSFDIVQTTYSNGKVENYIKAYWNDPLANPNNPECIKILHDLYRDTILIDEVNIDGCTGRCDGYYIIGKKEDQYGINTEEKIDAMMKTGIVKEQNFYGVSTYEMAWWREKSDEIQKKLKEAGWNTMTVDEFHKTWIYRKKTDIL